MIPDTDSERTITDTFINEDKLVMGPALAEHRSFSTDEFIETYQTAFAEYLFDGVIVRR